MAFAAKCFYGTCVLVWFLALMCVIAQPAYGYVDPGSGLFLLQVIGSTFVGLTFLLRKRLRQFLELFGRRSSKAGADIGER